MSSRAQTETYSQVLPSHARTHTLARTHTWTTRKEGRGNGSKNGVVGVRLLIHVLAAGARLHHTAVSRNATEAMNGQRASHLCPYAALYRLPCLARHPSAEVAELGHAAQHHQLGRPLPLCPPPTPQPPHHAADGVHTLVYTHCRAARQRQLLAPTLERCLHRQATPNAPVAARMLPCPRRPPSRARSGAGRGAVSHGCRRRRGRVGPCYFVAAPCC